MRSTTSALFQPTAAPPNQAASATPSDQCTGTVANISYIRGTRVAVPPNRPSTTASAAPRPLPKPTASTAAPASARVGPGPQHGAERPQAGAQAHADRHQRHQGHAVQRRLRVGIQEHAENQRRHQQVDDQGVEHLAHLLHRNATGLHLPPGQAGRQDEDHRQQAFVHYRRASRTMPRGSRPQKSRHPLIAALGDWRLEPNSRQCPGGQTPPARLSPRPRRSTGAAIAAG